MNTDNKNPTTGKRRRFNLRIKLILGFSVMAAFVSFITIGGIYSNLQNLVSNGFKNRLLGITKVAALQQNGDEFIKISSDQDPLYEKFRLQNTKIRNSDPEIVFVYTMRKDEQGIYFVVDAGEIGDEGFSAFNERYIDPGPTLVGNFDVMKEAIVEPEFYTDEYGTFLSAYAPIFSSDGTRVGVIGVDIQANTVIQQQRTIFFQSALVFLIAVALGIFFGYLAGNALTKPVIKLMQGTLAFASGKFDQRIEINSTDEISDLAITFNSMAEELQGLIDSLEFRVAQRTKQLEEQEHIAERRSYQFESITRIAKVIGKTKKLHEILPLVTEVISEQLGFYHVGIFLIDTTNQYAVLSTSNSPGGKTMLARGHQLKIGEQGIVGYVTQTGKPRVALDVGADANYFNNPDLPLTHSEMALPLKLEDRVIGALDIQSKDINAFSNEDVEVLATLADQVSLAIENARLFDQIKKSLAEADAIQRQYSRETWGRLPKEEKLGGYRYSIVGAVPLNEETESTIQDHKKDWREVRVPIILRGETIGTLSVQTPKNERISTDQMDLVKAVAERVALSAENARLFDETTRRAERERIVSDIASKIGTSFRTESILRTTATELSQLLEDADIFINLQAPNKDTN
jgi:GAF domain-containing protein/HAMP domain-containing protein